MGITVFKFVIWGGISSDIRSEILFYGDRIYDDIPPQMKKNEYGYPHSNVLLTFTHRKQFILCKT